MSRYLYRHGGQGLYWKMLAQASGILASAA
jgi:hypothetical protein